MVGGTRDHDERPRWLQRRVDVVGQSRRAPLPAGERLGHHRDLDPADRVARDLDPHASLVRHRQAARDTRVHVHGVGLERARHRVGVPPGRGRGWGRVRETTSAVLATSAQLTRRDTVLPTLALPAHGGQAPRPVGSLTVASHPILLLGEGDLADEVRGALEALEAEVVRLVRPAQREVAEVFERGPGRAGGGDLERRRRGVADGADGPRRRPGRRAAGHLLRPRHGRGAAQAGSSTAAPPRWPRSSRPPSPGPCLDGSLGALKLVDGQAGRCEDRRRRGRGGRCRHSRPPPRSGLC